MSTPALVPSFGSIGTILPPRPARALCRRAQWRSRMARLRATASAARSVLDGREHDGRLDRVGGLTPHRPGAKRAPTSSSESVLMLTCRIFPVVCAGSRRRGRGGRGRHRRLSDHRTSQNPTILDRTITHVTITDPQHCLFGKRLAVIRERSGRGPTYVVVELPDGRKRSIRIASTDLAATVIASGAASDLPRISVRTLIPLVQHLSANLALLAEEVIRDGSSSPSASRCVSTTADTHRRIPPAADGASAPLAEPLRRDANADRPNAGGADEANTAAPRRARKGDRSC